MKLKEQIRKVMMDHLHSKGYPNMTNEQVLQELKPMWIKLEEAKLIQQGWKFQQFAQVATSEYMSANMRSNLEAEFMKHFARKPR